MSLLGSIGRFVFGSTAGGLVDAGAKVASTVGEFVSTPKDREQFAGDLVNAESRDLQSARFYGAPGDHGTAFDVLVDGIIRLIRPFIAIDVLGGWNHWWALPSLDSFSPFQQWAIETVIVFYFGGRFVTKDLPVAVAALIRAWRNKG